MKLIYAIVNTDDSHSVNNALTKAGHSVTKLASTGGFLMNGNTTFLICAEDDKVDSIISIISEKSRKRKSLVPAGAIGGIEFHASALPIEVSVGGATIFVTDIERFVKV